MSTRIPLTLACGDYEIIRPLKEGIVQPDGTVGNIKVSRSLDASFGLDQEAMKALRQWQFAAGTRFGQPVPVLVTVEIAFTLR